MPPRPYWSRQDMDRDNVQPAVLAIGDSWFWYPIGSSLLDPINTDVWDQKYVIYAIGNNGAEARDYVEGKYRNAVKTALDLYGDGLSAVLISGGGNDFAGWSDMRRLLNRDCRDATCAEECFNPEPLKELFYDLKRFYVALAMQVEHKCSPGTQIVVHNYDYARPSGQGVIGDQRWLKTPMVDCKVPEARMQECVNFLIDGIGEVMKSLSESNARIRFVRSAGCLGDADWANEIHPNPAGFRKLAVERWAETLRKILP